MGYVKKKAFDRSPAPAGCSGCAICIGQTTPEWSLDLIIYLLLFHVSAGLRLLLIDRVRGQMEWPAAARSNPSVALVSTASTLLFAPSQHRPLPGRSS